MPPACHQTIFLMTGATNSPSGASFERWIHWYAAPAANTKPATIEAMPM